MCLREGWRRETSCEASGALTIVRKGSANTLERVERVKCVKNRSCLFLIHRMSVRYRRKLTKDEPFALPEEDTSRRHRSPSPRHRTIAPTGKTREDAFGACPSSSVRFSTSRSTSGGPCTELEDDSLHFQGAMQLLGLLVLLYVVCCIVGNELALPLASSFNHMSTYVSDQVGKFLHYALNTVEQWVAEPAPVEPPPNKFEGYFQEALQYLHGAFESN